MCMKRLKGRYKITWFSSSCSYVYVFIIVLFYVYYYISCTFSSTFFIFIFFLLRKRLGTIRSIVRSCRGVGEGKIRSPLDIMRLCCCTTKQTRMHIKIWLSDIHTNFLIVNRYVWFAMINIWWTAVLTNYISFVGTLLPLFNCI